MGDIYSQPNSKNEDKAVAAYRAALLGSPPAHKDAVLAADRGPTVTGFNRR